MPDVRADGAMVFGRRVIYPTEKNCINCLHHAECHEGVTLSFPSNFAKMNRWDERDISPYFKSIYGGICDNYMPQDERRRAIWIQRKNEALIKSGKAEWDF